MFLAGTVVRDGVDQPVLVPLLSRPVHLVGQSAARTMVQTITYAVSPVYQAELQLTADGEADLIPLISDLDLRADLLTHAEFGRGAFTANEASPELIRRMPALRKWIDEVVDAATGLHDGARIPVGTGNPLAVVGSLKAVQVFIGGAVYAAPEYPRPVAAAALQAWSRVDGLGRSSFGTLYPATPWTLDAGEPVAPSGPAGPVLSPFVLSPSQERVASPPGPGR